MATGNKAVIFYITDAGFKLAQRITGLFPEARTIRFKSEKLEGIWHSTQKIIFIMAAGIVVRTIAPFIKDKRIDPAVVVLDEKGSFVISLLSGHIGGANELARKIADFLNAQAVITTASDVQGRHSLDLPKNLVAGIGCNRGTTKGEIARALKMVLSKKGLSCHSIGKLATIDAKRNEKGLLEFARANGLDIDFFSKDELNSVSSAHGIKGSSAVRTATGAMAVSEPAAILGAKKGTILLPKTKWGNVTVAVAEQKIEDRRLKTEDKKLRRWEDKKISTSQPLNFSSSQSQNSSLITCHSSLQGKIYIVGTGPGSLEHITPAARMAIKKADVIVGYKTYLDLIQELIKGKLVISSCMREEIDRCKKALELALTGKTVALISGGDPGIYAMAGLVFELLRAQSIEDRTRIEKTVFTSQNSELNSSPVTCHLSLSVEVIPGIAALNACAARLGAPLMHDFVSISLSDRLTPWDVIEKRLEAAAAADFVIILYNPKSKERAMHIAQARDIILKYRSPQTPVGIVRAAMRDNEEIIITDLEGMLKNEIDMQTTVIVGNSQTFVWENWIVTPRGYGNKFEIG